ncbi:MAG: hypothetical protein LBG42_04975 [Treponema sp.]|jgi:hypothetical protein|nr:hypothetical protein [Treponema sp.]
MWWLLPIAGAGTGIVSTILGSNKEQEALERQKEMDRQKYLLGKEYSDKQYAINRGEAQIQGAVQQGRLTENMSRSADQFNLGLLSQAYGIQNAQIQTASSIGASLAAEGMSGTRGNAANALMRDYEQTNLDRNVALQERGNELSLAGMLSQANNAAADITRERESWNTGGYRYRQKEAQDAYNLSMAQLGQSAYDWQIEQADWTALDLITGGLQGASLGLNLWNSWNDASQLMGDPTAAAAGANAGAGADTAAAAAAASTPSVGMPAAPTPPRYISPGPAVSSWDTVFDIQKSLRDYSESLWGKK